MRPTPTAAAAEPMVKKTVGSPEKRLEPNICSASSAPTVMPAARPAPLRICANSSTVRVRRCSGGSSRTLVLVERAGDPLMWSQPRRLKWLACFWSSGSAAQPVSEGKYPSKRAQDWALAPAIGPTAAVHGAHCLDEQANDRKEEIDAQDVARYATQHGR